MNCTRCKGTLFVKRGDELIVCPRCHGTGEEPGQTVEHRSGAGPHGGTAKQKNKRERKKAKEGLR